MAKTTVKTTRETAANKQRCTITRTVQGNKVVIVRTCTLTTKPKKRAKKRAKKAS